ncbi:hypothetical protein D3C73_722150 [compost metagenome]
MSEKEMLMKHLLHLISNGSHFIELFSLIDAVHNRFHGELIHVASPSLSTSDICQFKRKRFVPLFSFVLDIHRFHARIDPDL